MWEGKTKDMTHGEQKLKQQEREISKFSYYKF